MSSKVRSHESSSDEDDESHKRNKSDESERLKSKKTAPNILISGTPCVGKSTLCSLVQEKYSRGGGQIEVVNIGQLAKEKGFLGEFDDARECPEIDEDAIIDDLEPKMSGQIGCDVVVIVDYHATDFFPERWFDAVFILRTNNTLLYDRLKARGYKEAKVEENLQCEIFQTILDEAKESYREEIVHELTSESQEDIESNAGRIVQWIEAWKSQNK